MIYRRPPSGTHPPNDSPGYRSTTLRHPKEPLIIIPHTLSELTGPVYPYGRIDASDNDLTRQHQGEPLGERIIVQGRVLDEDGRPIPNTLVEVWQANAAGRYAHRVDDHPAPLDPNFSGAGRTLTDDRGTISVCDHQARRLSVAQSSQRLAPRAHSFFACSARSFLSRLITQMYFPGDPLMPYDPILNSIPDERARQRLVAGFDWNITEPEWALGFTFDIVLCEARTRLPMET